MIIVLCVFVVFLTGWILLMPCRKGHRDWPKLKQFRYAHRGYHKKPTVPENSMAAFRAAVERGWGVELDVHLMKDGNLAVIHDASLLRTAGVDVSIEDLTKADLANYRLEDSEEQIPLLEEVLELFTGKAPLIIELKAEKGNGAALSEAVANVLESWEGDYCVESFDPRVVNWFRKHRPDICRGQLAEDFFSTNTKLSFGLKLILTNLLANVGTRPDFIAYQFEHRNRLGMRLCRMFWKPVEVSWTIRSKSDMETAEQEGKLVIFEQFDPEGV